MLHTHNLVWPIEDDKGQQLNHVQIHTITAGKAKNTQQKAAMTTLGIEPADLAQRMEADARGTLLDVFDRLKNISPDQREDVVTDLFGEKSTAAKTSAHQLAQLRVRFDHISVALGQRLLPIVNKMLPPLLSVVDSINKFAEANPKLATGLLVATAAVIPLLKAGSAIVKFSRLVKGNGLGKDQDRLHPERDLFAAKLNKMRRAAKPKRATLQLARLNRELNNLGSQSLSDFGGRDSGGSDGDDSRRKRKKRPRKRPRSRIRNAGGLPRKSSRFDRLIARTSRFVGSIFSGTKMKPKLSGAMSKVGAALCLKARASYLNR